MCTWSLFSVGQDLQSLSFRRIRLWFGLRWSMDTLMTLHRLLTIYLEPLRAGWSVCDILYYGVAGRKTWDFSFPPVVAIAHARDWLIDIRLRAGMSALLRINFQNQEYLASTYRLLRRSTHGLRKPITRRGVVRSASSSVNMVMAWIMEILSLLCPEPNIFLQIWRSVLGR